MDESGDGELSEEEMNLVTTTGLAAVAAGFMQFSLASKEHPSRGSENPGLSGEPRGCCA